MRTEYDLIVSLGGNCYVAKQLQHRGMRPFSLPLDWTLMDSPSVLEHLPELIRSHFSGFCVYENMMEFAPPEREGRGMTYKFKDCRTGFKFVHHFHAPLSDASAFARSREVIERRIRRLYEKVAAASNALFVIETSFPFDESVLYRIYNALAEVFPGVDADLFAMQFHHPQQDKVKLGEHIELLKCRRGTDLFCDVYGTSSDWNWLEDIRVKGVARPGERRKSRFVTRCKYRLWKALGKSLYKEGAGCLGVTVP